MIKTIFISFWHWIERSIIILNIFSHNMWRLWEYLGSRVHDHIETHDPWFRLIRRIRIYTHVVKLVSLHIGSSVPCVSSPVSGKGEMHDWLQECPWLIAYILLRTIWSMVIKENPVDFPLWILKYQPIKLNQSWLVPATTTMFFFNEC